MENYTEFNSRGTTPERSTGGVISHAFDMYKGIFLYAIAAVLIYGLLSSLASMLTGFDSQGFVREIQSANGDYTRIDYQNIPGLQSYYAVSGLISILLAPIFAGLIYIANKYNSGAPISFNDLFIGYKQNLVQILIYSFLSGVIMMVAAMLCVLPVFFVAPLLAIGLPILIFENATAVDALKKSFNIAKANYGTFLGATIVGILISIAGIFLCGVGIILTYPFMYVVMYSLYVAFVGKPREIIYAK